MNDSSYAVGWITLALINAGLAETKGFSRLIAFIVSLLIGPIATFIIVVRSPKSPQGVAKEKN
jgi:F0F1-type ATP synthase assembly protein I